MSEEYQIDLVEHWSFLNAQRNPVDGYRVTFVLPSLGITDHVLIEKRMYNPDNVREAIEALVAKHLEIFKL